MLGLACFVSAQDNVLVSRIPASADRPTQFAPYGWKVEKIARGDLNGDHQTDQAISLIEDKNLNPESDLKRVLVVAFAAAHKLGRVEVTDKLLQCATCGGALYGMLDAPTQVTISKGVLIIRQDHGSREVVESTFRFRYDDQSKRFLLIGYDYNYYDRALAIVVTESTNYLTGFRITTREGKGKRTITKRAKIIPTHTFLDSLDADELENATGERLGLG
jgi:hypothetical protein